MPGGLVYNGRRLDLGERLSPSHLTNRRSGPVMPPAAGGRVFIRSPSLS